MELTWNLRFGVLVCMNFDWHLPSLLVFTLSTTAATIDSRVEQSQHRPRWPYCSLACYTSRGHGWNSGDSILNAVHITTLHIVVLGQESHTLAQSGPELLCSPGWTWTYSNPPASASQMLGWQVSYHAQLHKFHSFVSSAYPLYQEKWTLDRLCFEVSVGCGLFWYQLDDKASIPLSKKKEKRQRKRNNSMYYINAPSTCLNL